MRVLFLLLTVPMLSWGNIEVLKSSADELLLEVKTPRPVIETIQLHGKNYSRIVSPEMEFTLPLGYPMVPSLNSLVAISPGTKPVISIEEFERKEIPLRNELAFNNQEHDHCGFSRKVKRNLNAYRAVYGRKAAVIEELGYAVSDRLARIQFWPFQYRGIQKRLFWISSFRVKVKFVPDTLKSSPAVGGASNSVAQYVVINPLPQRPVKETVSRAVELFISHPSYGAALSRYFDFKRLQGYEIKEVYVEGKSAQEIKALISEAYASEVPPVATTLVGNIDQIPAWRGSGDNRWTDANYTVLDDDSFPDISLGRIPAHHVEELNAFLDKAIAREKEPREIEKVLLTAGKDQSLGCPANVSKVGSKIKAGFDAVLLTKKYKTEVSTQEVLEAYNQNPNIIVYDGHGNRQGMTEIPLLISQLNQLDNRVYPIILDIACLNANWGSSSSPRNFAESILMLSQKGAAGIMASGGSGYGHDFFQSIGELMGKVQASSPIDSKMNQIGQVILAAKLKHGTQDRTYWNYYGDPTSSVWESDF